MRAREIRGDLSFGEQIIDIADVAQNDWTTAQNGRPIVNKEVVLRSKLRIASRQFHMSRLHHTTNPSTAKTIGPCSANTSAAAAPKNSSTCSVSYGSRHPARRPWSIAGKKRLRKLNRAGSVGKLDPLPGGRADGARVIRPRSPSMRGLRAESSPARKRPALSAAGFWHRRRSESERRGICVGPDMAAPGGEQVLPHPH
jgi:hypothetical protein